MQAAGCDPTARHVAGPPLAEQAAQVRAAAEKAMLRAREIRADSRRIAAEGRRIRGELAAQRERLSAGFFAISLRRAERAWGEAGWPLADEVRW